MPTEKPLTIVSLEAENFKRLRAIRIAPNGEGIVEIRGNNGEGKSSTLDAIAAVLGGEKLCPAEPIRRGEKTAEATVDLGEFRVTRRWTEKGSTLKVTTADGAAFSSPQKMLDKMIGSLSFDPLEFSRQKPAAQNETLRKMLGIDFMAIDAKRKDRYDARTAANANVRDMKAIVDAAQAFPDAPAEEVVVAELLAQQDAAQAKQREKEAAQRAVAAAKSNVSVGAQWVTDKKAQIAEIETQLAAMRETLAKGEATLLAREAAVIVAETARDAIVVPDIEPIRTKIGTAEATNRQVRANRERAANVGKLEAAEVVATTLTTEIDALDAEKVAALSSKKFPIAGLGLSDGGVTFRGLPLDQASQAERIRVSLAIGISMNPKLRVLLVRDGSLLDEKSMELVAAMAQEAGAQVWIETVSKGNGTGIIIEDGQVSGG